MYFLHLKKKWQKDFFSYSHRNDVFGIFINEIWKISRIRFVGDERNQHGNTSWFHQEAMGWFPEGGLHGCGSVWHHISVGFGRPRQSNAFGGAYAHRLPTLWKEFERLKRWCLFFIQQKMFLVDQFSKFIFGWLVELCAGGKEQWWKGHFDDEESAHKRRHVNAQKKAK